VLGVKGLSDRGYFAATWCRSTRAAGLAR